MKKHILLAISLVALSLGTMAQDAVSLFRTAVDKLKAYNNIEIEFDYTMINTEAGIYETMSGSGIMQGDAFRLNIMDQDILCDGTTTWNYNADAEEVMISDVDSSERGGTPWELIESYYDNITAKIVETNGNTKQIEIKSLLGKDNVEKLIVTIDTKTSDFKDLHVFNKDKNEFVYTITKFVTNQKLPADFFTFKESDYPDAEIIDMR